MENLGASQKPDAKGCIGELGLALAINADGDGRGICPETLACPLFLAGIGFNTVPHLDMGDLTRAEDKPVIIQHGATISRWCRAAGKFAFEPQPLPERAGMGIAGITGHNQQHQDQRGQSHDVVSF